MTETQLEQLGLADIAALLGVAYGTVKAYHLRRAHGFPEPAGRIEDSPQKGRSSPYWRRADIEAWMAQRPGPGHYDRSRVTAADRRPEAGPRRRSGQRRVCPQCAITVELTLSGTLHVHGPRNNRCPGSAVVA